MRRHILAGAAALAMAGVVAAPVRAQWTVIDPANLAQAIEQVRQLVQQLQLLQQQLLVLEQQYAQLVRSYEAIAHLPDRALNELGRQLDVDRLRNVLPDASEVLGAVISGVGLGPGELGAVVRGHLERNGIYLPPGADFQAAEMRRNATSVAGAQAMASALYQSASDRVSLLRGIEGQLATAPDAKAVADLQARLAAEQAYVQAQQVQVQSLAMWQQAQQRNQQQRQEEQRRQEIDRLIQQAVARGG
jgi:type IV secretion system protein VirB5